MATYQYRPYDPYQGAMKMLAPAPVSGGSSTAPAAPAYSYSGTPAPAASAPTPTAGVQAASQALTPTPKPATTPVELGRQGQATNQTQGTSPFQKGKEDPFWAQVREGLSQEDLTDLKDYIQYLYSLPDYKGRNEANRAEIARYARELRKRAKDNALDYHGIAKIGDEYGGLQDQLAARLAAQGINGPAVAGAYSNLQAKEGAAIGDYVSEQDIERRREQLQRDLADAAAMRQMQQYALQQNIAMQNDPGFWGDVLGLAGTVGGFALPGIGGALGSLVGGMFGGKKQRPEPSALY